MITIIKLIHTSIWLIMAFAVFYIVYAGVMNVFNLTVLASIVLIVLETIVLLIYKWRCPLTPIAEKYTLDRNDNFDIYLPNWLARYNKIIFGTLFVIGVVLITLNQMLNN